MATKTQAQPRNSTSNPLPPDTGLTSPQLAAALRRLKETDRPRLKRLWTYYHNPMRPAILSGAENPNSEKPYRQGQEWGLPPRITGYLQGEVCLAAQRSAGIARKEVVVENDIAWRVDTMVDHLFGRPFILTSTATAPDRRDALGELLWAILEANGGMGFLQNLAILGMVYGFVDVIVKLDTVAATSLRLEIGDKAWATLLSGAKPAKTRSPQSAAVEADALQSIAETSAPTPAAGGDLVQQTDTGPGLSPDAGQLIERLARLIRFEIVHPSHALPNPAGENTYLRAWETQRCADVPEAAASDRRWWWARPRPESSADTSETQHLELFTPTRWFRLDGPAGAPSLTASGDLPLGQLPVVHIQNLALPFDYAGRSDVEPLIPIQDELNTRLSDRAYRITMGSFKMFLGKGIDNFLSLPVSPGRMWQTDSDDAEITEFGGDDRCPSEEQHISDLREAMDKTSGVPPVAAGLIRDRVGNLSSAAALRVTLQSLLAKTERKRSSYGQGVARLCALSLAWLDAAGLLPTPETDRTIEIIWPSDLPENTLERLQEAEIKSRLGVPKDTILREIGY